MAVIDWRDKLGNRDYEKAEAARMVLEAGDRVLIRRHFAAGSRSWSDSFSKTCWEEMVIERATKTTIVVDGVTYLRSRGTEKGKEKGSMFALCGEYPANTQDEIATTQEEVKLRDSLRYGVDRVAKQVSKAVFSARRLPDMQSVLKVKEHLDAISAIIGKDEK